MKKILSFSLLFLAWASAVFALPVEWKRAESGHFIVFYKNADKSFIENVISESEQYYSYITVNFGLQGLVDWTQEKRAKVYIFDTKQQYQANTGQPDWSDGSVIMRLRVIYSFSGAKKFFQKALPHEMAHIIFREIVGFDNRNIPSWLEEGFASFAEAIDLHKVESELKTALEKGSLISLAKLSEMKIRLKRNSYEIDLFYKQSLSIVNYLIKKFGKDKFLIFCRSFKDSDNLDKELKKTFGFRNIGELEKSWRRHLETLTMSKGRSL